MGLGLGSIITAGNAFWGLAVWATVRPGASPVGEWIGWGTDKVATQIANYRYTSSTEKLSDSTLQKIDTAVSRVVKWCEAIRLARLAKTPAEKQRLLRDEQEPEASYWNMHTRAWKDFTKTSPGRLTIWVIKTIAPNAVVAVEKSVRLAAYKVERFFHLKTFDLAKAPGYQEITDALNNSTVFQTMRRNQADIQKRNRTIVVDARVQTLHEEIQTILRDNIPATGEKPSWGQTIGFGLGWGTQIGITWMLRLYAYQWAMGFVPPELRFHNIALITCGLFYLNGLAAHTRGQIRALDKEIKTKRLDCRNLLSDNIIETIVDTAKSKLDFLNPLLKKQKDDNPWDEIKANLQSISKAKKTSDQQTTEEGTLGAISDSDDETEEELIPIVKDEGKKVEIKKEVVVEPAKDKQEEDVRIDFPDFDWFKQNQVSIYEQWMFDESKGAGLEAALKNLPDHLKQLESYMGIASKEKDYILAGELQKLSKTISQWIKDKQIKDKQITDTPYTPIPTGNGTSNGSTILDLSAQQSINSNKK